MLSGRLLPFFIFLTLWCVSSYSLLVDKGLRYVTKWWPKWKWNQAGFTLNSTLSLIYLRWVRSFEFSHTGDHWNIVLSFNYLLLDCLFKKNNKRLKIYHPNLPLVAGCRNGPTFKEDLKAKKKDALEIKCILFSAWLIGFDKLDVRLNDVLRGCQSWSLGLAGGPNSQSKMLAADNPG